MYFQPILPASTALAESLSAERTSGTRNQGCTVFWMDTKSQLLAPPSQRTAPRRRHPAVFPVGVPEFFIKLFSKEGDNVLDPFGGSGTTGLAAAGLKRNAVLIDTKEDYFETMKVRLGKVKNATVKFIAPKGYSGSSDSSSTKSASSAKSS